MTTFRHACERCDKDYSNDVGQSGLCPECEGMSSYTSRGARLLQGIMKEVRQRDPSSQVWPDPEYAEQDEDGQLSIGVTGEQRAIPGLAAPRREHPTFDMGA